MIIIATYLCHPLNVHSRPVGSGKTALTLALCRLLRTQYNIGVVSWRFGWGVRPDSHPATVTNDIFTREDQEFLIKNRALPSERILAIETGGCPHAAIREDISANMGALETLQAKFGCQLLFVESGGDNLAANYSRELADYIIYVIDVSVRKRFHQSTSFLPTKRDRRAVTRSPERVALEYRNQIYW